MRELTYWLDPARALAACTCVGAGVAVACAGAGHALRRSPWWRSLFVALGALALSAALACALALGAQ